MSDNIYHNHVKAAEEAAEQAMWKAFHIAEAAGLITDDRDIAEIHLDHRDVGCICEFCDAASEWMQLESIACFLADEEAGVYDTEYSREVEEERRLARQED